MKNISFLFFLLFLLSACNIDEQQAKVIDSEVEGLEYQCAGLFYYTDKNGTLTCNHMPIAFMIGQIKLGLLYKLPQDSLILPQDIVAVARENGDDKNVIKILTLLQSLDEDQNPENGIKIPKELHEKLTTFIDIKKMNLAEIQELIESQLEKEVKFKEPQKVLLHLQKSMKRYNLPKLKSKILEEFEAGENNNSSSSDNNNTDNNNTNNNNTNNSSTDSNNTKNNTEENNSSADINSTRDSSQIDTNSTNDTSLENNRSSKSHTAL